MDPDTPVAWVHDTNFAKHYVGREEVVTLLQAYRGALRPGLFSARELFRVGTQRNRRLIGSAVDVVARRFSGLSREALVAEPALHADRRFAFEMIAIGAVPRDGRDGWRRWTSLASVMTNSVANLLPDSDMVDEYCVMGGLDGNFDLEEGWDWIFESVMRDRPEVVARLLAHGYRADKRAPIRIVRSSGTDDEPVLREGQLQLAAPNAPAELDAQGRPTGRRLVTAQELAAALGHEAVLHVLTSHRARSALRRVRERAAATLKG
jgi:hypothetical protein